MVLLHQLTYWIYHNCHHFLLHGSFNGRAFFGFLLSPDQQRIPVKAHAESKLHRLARIDWIGTIVLTIGVICFLLGLTTGGSEYPWNSAFVISFTTVGACLIAVFFVWEAVWAKNGVLPIEFYVRRFVRFTRTGRGRDDADFSDGDRRLAPFSRHL